MQITGLKWKDTGRYLAGTGQWVMRTPEQQVVEYATKTVGGVAGACSAALRRLLGQRVEDRGVHDGAWPLEVLELETLPEVAWPVRYRLVMESGPYRYEATSDADVEHVVLMLEGALKFFAFKMKLVTIEEEVCRNREVAAAEGLLTREDG